MKNNKIYHQDDLGEPMGISLFILSRYFLLYGDSFSCSGTSLLSKLGAHHGGVQQIYSLTGGSHYYSYRYVACIFSAFFKCFYYVWFVQLLQRI